MAWYSEIGELPKYRQRFGTISNFRYPYLPYGKEQVLKSVSRKKHHIHWKCGKGSTRMHIIIHFHKFALVSALEHCHIVLCMDVFVSVCFQLGTHWCSSWWIWWMRFASLDGLSIINYVASSNSKDFWTLKDCKHFACLVHWPVHDTATCITLHILLVFGSLWKWLTTWDDCKSKYHARFFNTLAHLLMTWGCEVC